MSGSRVLCVAALFAVGNSQMLGPADLKLKSVKPCSEGGKYQSQLNITQHKFNRTTDAFDIQAMFHIWMDDQVGIYISVSQLLDGGYKKTYEMRDDNACEFLMKHAPQQITSIFRMAGIREKCPIPPGSYSLQNYMFDFKELPHLLYGDFQVDAHIINDNKLILCLRLHIITKPKDPIHYIG